MKHESNSNQYHNSHCRMSSLGSEGHLGSSLCSVGKRGNHGNRLIIYIAHIPFPFSSFAWQSLHNFHHNSLQEIQVSLPGIIFIYRDKNDALCFAAISIITVEPAYIKWSLCKATTSLLPLLI